jgi:hypothetical protein
MKNLFSVSTLIIALTFLVSCSKNSNTTESLDQANIVKKTRAAAPGKTKDWDKNIEHDCTPDGCNCAVIVPDKGIIKAINDNTLSQYVLDNNSTIGFSDAVINAIIVDQTIVNSKRDIKGNIQVRVNY